MCSAAQWSFGVMARWFCVAFLLIAVSLLFLRFSHDFVLLLFSGRFYDAWPTEGGHAEMSPRNDLEYEFIKVKHAVRKVKMVDYYLL